MYPYIRLFVALEQFLLALKFTSPRSMLNIAELYPDLHIFSVFIFQHCVIEVVICQLYHELKLCTPSPL